MNLAVQNYIKGDTLEGYEKQEQKCFTKINFTFAIPCNDIIACSFLIVKTTKIWFVLFKYSLHVLLQLSCTLRLK